MRVDERTPWADRRTPRHDAMCLAVASNAGRVFHRYTGHVCSEIEAPIGPGFADVLCWTDAPRDEREWAIVEVKTNAERTTGGDIIRQLRWYRERLGLPAKLILVVEPNWDAPAAMQDLILMAGIEVLPVTYFMGAA